MPLLDKIKHRHPGVLGPRPAQSAEQQQRGGRRQSGSLRPTSQSFHFLSIAWSARKRRTDAISLRVAIGQTRQGTQRLGRGSLRMHIFRARPAAWWYYGRAASNQGVSVMVPSPIVESSQQLLANGRGAHPFRRERLVAGNV